MAFNGADAIPGSIYEPQLRMIAYATRHHFTMAAAYGSSECELHLYWVRPGIADYDAILSAIRDHPYYFLEDGELSFDYRDHQPPPAACADSLVY